MPPVKHPRPVRESSCPIWSFLPVAWFLPDWRFPFLRLRLRSSSPCPGFALFSSHATRQAQLGTPSLREVRAEGWSELSPRCVGAAARRAGLSPLFCDAPISRRPVCFLMHTLPPFGPAELGGFFLEFLRTDSEFGASRPLRERIRGHRGSISLRSFFSRH